MGAAGVVVENRALIFTYGTLKKGFSNHGLLEDMMASGDAAYLGIYRTVEKLPLVCGPYRVPFLLNFPGSSGANPVWGELYQVSSKALAKMDELEGISKGHYQRLPLEVVQEWQGGEETTTTTTTTNKKFSTIWVEAYYAHGSYAEAMWKRNGYKGYSCYTQKEARGYVKRKDRPPHLSFLDHIRIFLSSSSSSSSTDDNSPPNYSTTPAPSPSAIATLV